VPRRASEVDSGRWDAVAGPRVRAVGAGFRGSVRAARASVRPVGRRAVRRSRRNTRDGVRGGGKAEVVVSVWTGMRSADVARGRVWEPLPAEVVEGSGPGVRLRRVEGWVGAGAGVWAGRTEFHAKAQSVR